MNNVPPFEQGHVNPEPLAFNPVLQKLPPERRAAILGITQKDNPQAGAEFITGKPPGEVVPTLFSYLIAEDQNPANKANALSNVRTALINPSSSGLSQKISTDSDTYFSEVVSKCGQKIPSFIVSTEAQRYLNEMLSNFQAELPNAQAKTLSGQNPNIFRYQNHPYNHLLLLEAVVAGSMDSNLPRDFRQTLVRTLLFAGSNPDFVANITHDVASYRRRVQISHLIPKIMGMETPEQKKQREQGDNEALKIELEMAQFRAGNLENQLRQSQSKVHDQTRTMGEKDAQIRDLQERVRRAESGSGLGESEKDKKLKRLTEDLRDARSKIANLQELLEQAASKRPGHENNRSPWQILKVSQTATPEEIYKQYRRLIRTCHPDRVGGIMDKGGANQDEQDWFKNLAKERAQDINLAYEQLKKMGRAK